jgi:hypothetical protein
VYDDLPELQEVSDSSEEEFSSDEDEASEQDNDILDGHSLNDLFSMWTVSDDLGEAYTRTYNAAYLAGPANPSGVVTELYDSGCSRHITPYRSKLINFVEITLKAINAARNTVFEAIGRGDLKIKVPGP